MIIMLSIIAYIIISFIIFGFVLNFQPDWHWAIYNILTGLFFPGFVIISLIIEISIKAWAAISSIKN
jgi:hypothetical protein